MTDDMRWIPHGNLKTKSVFLKIGDGFEDFIQESLTWCEQNNLTYWRSSYDIIHFTKDIDRIAFLLRFG